MKAMLLAAGRGERMRPLTDALPKPLLEVGGLTLIEYHIDQLVSSKITELVINHAYLGHKITEHLGDGSRYGAHISYSDEGSKALETGGGIFNALGLLGPDPFVVVNADIWTDFPISGLPSAPLGLAHLVLVDTPAYKAKGDFALRSGMVSNQGDPCYTFSGIGVYRPELFQGCSHEPFPLAPLLRTYADAGQISGEHYTGQWYDVGTPARLSALDHKLRNNDL